MQTKHGINLTFKGSYDALEHILSDAGLHLAEEYLRTGARTYRPKGRDTSQVNVGPSGGELVVTGSVTQQIYVELAKGLKINTE